MNKNQPINYVNGNFIYLGDKKEFARGEKEFITLPNKEKIKVSNLNIWKSIKDVYIPISQMFANICNVQFVNSISSEDKIAFYDIETSDTEDFLLGYVNNKRFNNPKEMMEELIKFEVAVSFNGFIFDNQVLFKNCPNYFYEIKNATFITHTIKGVVNIDIFRIMQTILTLEGYSAEYLAKHNGFVEELLDYKSPKNKKCEQDIRILKFLWEKYNIPKVFNVLSKLSNIDITLMQIIPKSRLRKWILMNLYLQKGYLPLRPRNPEIKLSSEPVKYFKKGVYEDYSYWDIKNCYPTTAINLGNLGIYENDNTFSELQKMLYDLSQDIELKPFIKGISNPLVGSQYSQNEFFKDEQIFDKIVGVVASKVKNILNKRKDIVYINTDCFVCPKNSPKPEIEGYEIKKDYDFKFLYIYNQNKWIGKTIDGKVVYRGFKRFNSNQPKIFYIAREEIISRIKKSKDKEEFMEIINNSEKLVSKTIRKLKKFPEEYFSIKVRKKDDYCRDIALASLWKKLNIGFSNIYLDEKDGYVIKLNKNTIKTYKKELINLAEEYRTTND